MSDLERVLTERKIEELRQYFSHFFNKEHTTDEALNLIVEHVHSRYLPEIVAMQNENSYKGE